MRWEETVPTRPVQGHGDGAADMVRHIDGDRVAYLPVPARQTAMELPFVGEALDARVLTNGSSIWLVMHLAVRVLDLQSDLIQHLGVPKACRGHLWT